MLSKKLHFDSQKQHYEKWFYGNGSKGQLCIKEKIRNVDTNGNGMLFLPLEVVLNLLLKIIATNFTDYFAALLI
jgi:hypothetical protein